MGRFSFFFAPFNLCHSFQLRLNCLVSSNPVFLLSFGSPLQAHRRLAFCNKSTLRLLLLHPKLSSNLALVSSQFPLVLALRVELLFLSIAPLDSLLGELLVEHLFDFLLLLGLDALKSHFFLFNHR